MSLKDGVDSRVSFDTDPARTSADQADREQIINSRKDIVDKLNTPDYVKQLEDILADLESGDYIFEHVNHFEQGEQMLGLKNVTSGALRQYGFEYALPLSGILSKDKQAVTEPLKIKIAEWLKLIKERNELTEASFKTH
jgi:hypothetical protein